MMFWFIFQKNNKGVKQIEDTKPFKKSVPVKKPIPEEKKEVKEDVKKTKSNKKRETRKRGLVYLSHIPHGFYEVNFKILISTVFVFELIQYLFEIVVCY